MKVSKSEYEKLGASPATFLPHYFRKRKTPPPPPPPRSRSRSRYREPASDLEDDDLLQLGGFSVGYSGRRGNPNSSNEYSHNVWWKNGSFTMDGEIWRKIDENPQNQSFWESVTHYAIPDEFKEEGRHHMSIKYMEPDQEWEPLGKQPKVYQIMGDQEI